jgi:dihydropyrimidinase
MSPPIREAGHGKALQAALSSGILQVTCLSPTLISSSVKLWSH